MLNSDYDYFYKYYQLKIQTAVCKCIEYSPKKEIS